MARSKPTIDALSKIGKEISSDAPHFRLQIPPELDGLVSDMRAMLIDIIETNPAIRSGGILRRPVYQRLLGEALRPGDPSLQMADEAIPQNPNEAVVRDEIQRIAKLISPLIVASEEDHPLPETQIAVSKGVEIILYAHLRKNLEAIAKSKIFYLGKDHWASTEDIKKALQKTIASTIEGKIQAKEATVYLLHQLGAISNKEILQRSKLKGGRTTRRNKGKRTIEFSDYDHAELEREVEESMTAARQFMNELITWLQTEIRRQKRRRVLNGDTPRPFPDINMALRNKTTFDMLKALFGKEIDHRDSNDAQMFLIFFLAHWNYQRYLEPINTRTQNQCDRAITTLFTTGEEQKGYEPLLSFDEDTFEISDSSPFTQDLRGITINGRNYPMYLEEMGVKGPYSFMAKILHKQEGLKRTQDIGDLFRTRLVAWNLTREDMEENETVQEDLKTICTQVANNLNLQEASQAPQTMRDLKKGEYWVEKPEKGNPFTKFTLKARLHNGAPFELQIIPLDLHCFEETEGSGIEHDLYKAGVYGDVLQMLIPRSTSPLTHEAIENNRAARAELRKKTMEAMNAEEIRNFFREFKSRSLVPSSSSPSAAPEAAQG